MRYTDEELYEKDVEDINYKKLNLSANEYFNWSIDVLTKLIKESVVGDDWLEPSKNHLREYRTKAIEKFFIPKLVRRT